MLNGSHADHIAPAKIEDQFANRRFFPLQRSVAPSHEAFVCRELDKKKIPPRRAGQENFHIA